MNQPAESDGNSSSIEALLEQTLCQSCSYTFRKIWSVLKYKEFFLPLLFFVINGFLLPNFDDLHYVFLTEKCGMSKSTYDFLNIITYVSLIIFIAIYNQFMTGVQI
jgi:hypothetical protein